jgi:hypothetical protein
VKRLVGLGAVVGLLGALFSMPPSAAQTDPIDDLTGPIEETVNEAADTVNQTVEDTVDSVENAGGSVSDTVEEAASGAVGGAGSATGDDGGSLGGTGSDTAESGGDVIAGASSGETTRAQQRVNRNARGQVRQSREGGFRDAQMARVAAEAGGNFPSGAAAYIPLLVQLTNDADRDGSYSDAEAAPLPDADIPLQVKLENTGVGSLSVLALRDGSPEPMTMAASAACGGLLGLQLQPGQSKTCRFTAEGFAPGQGQRAVVLLEIDVIDTTHPDVTGTVSDTTLIGTGMGNVLGRVLRRILASTGTQIILLIGIAIALATIGAALLALSHMRSPSELLVSQAMRIPARASRHVVRGVPTASRSRRPRGKQRRAGLEPVSNGQRPGGSEASRVRAPSRPRERLSRGPEVPVGDHPPT